MASKVINTILNFKDNFTPKIKQAAEGVNRTKKEVKSLERQMKRGQNQINKFGKSLNETFKNSTSLAIKTTGAVAGIAGALATKTGFSEAFNMEGYKMQLETATKSTETAAKKMSNAIKFANRTPFETGKIVEASAKLESMGLNSDKWLKPLADMAGSTNKSISQSVEAMVDASVGEFERLKEFGIRKDQIIAASAKKYGKDVVFNAKGQVTDQVKLQEVLMDMMNKKYKGGAKKLAGTAKGLWSTVTGVTKSSLAKIVGMNEDGTVRQGSLYDQLKGKIKGVANTLTKWQKDGTIKKIADKVENVAGKAFNFLGNAISFVKDNFNWLAPVASGVLATFIAFNVISKITMLFSTLTTIIKGVTAAQSALNFVMSANPIGAIAVAIGLLVAAGIALYKNWDTVQTKAVDLWKGIKKAFAPVGDFFAGIWEGVKKGFRSLINFIIKGINMWIKIQLTPLNLLIKGANKIPGVNIKKISFEIPEIKSFAKGTPYFKGGLAQINERGGEIVDLPNGSRIIPADKSEKIINNTKNSPIFNIYINGMNKSTDQIMNEVVPKIKLAMSNI